MIEITNVLFWISTGLLVPVVVVLLIVFVRSLLMMGNFIGMYISRIKYQKIFNEYLEGIRNGEKKIEELSLIKGNAKLKIALKSVFASTNKVYADKTLLDFENDCEKDLASSKSISKLGPMLGLMGTLIPMGPALVGLAAGDISSMAENMQVAFSTTVIGLFAGALGYMLQLIKQRWYVEDLNNLEFVFNVKYQEDVLTNNM